MAVTLVTWTWTYSILAGIFLMFGVIYTIFTRVSFKRSPNAAPGQRSAQISYVLAVFVKGFGLLGSAYLTSPKSSSIDHAWEKYSIISGGLPGYTTSLAYCFIFFSWCSICYEYLVRGQRTFYDKSRCFIRFLTISILVLATVSMIVVVVSRLYIAHVFEALVAIIRDSILATAFLIYLHKIYSLFETPCPSMFSPETRFLLLCGLIIMALIVRVLSIALYIFYFYNADKPTGTDQRIEFGDTYYFIFLVEFALSELLPLGAIGLFRLLSDSPEQAISSDNVIAFMPFE